MLSKILKNKKALIAGVVVVAVIGAIVYSISGSKSNSINGQTVIYSQVARRTLQGTTVLSGTLGHKTITTVSAMNSAFVSSTDATANSVQNQGDTLFSLNGRKAIAENGTLPFFRSLGPGDVGNDVLELKQILASSGDNPGAMNNIFTQQTQSALAQWQAQNGYPSGVPASKEAVTVALQQGTGYNLGAQSSAGLVIGPPAPTAQLSSYSVSHFIPARSRHLIGKRYRFSGKKLGHHHNRSKATRRHKKRDRHLNKSGLKRNGSRQAVLASFSTESHLSGPVPHTTTLGLTITGTTSTTPGTSVTFTVNANEAAPQNTYVYLTVGGSALAGVDYVPFNTTLELDSGAISTSFTVTTLPNQTIEPNKFLDIVLSQSPSGGYYVSEPSAAALTIDEPTGTLGLPTLTLTSSTTYLDKGAPFEVVIGLDQAYGQSVTVQLAYSGTAVAGTDYVEPSGNIVVPAGYTSLTVPIATVSNNLVEPDKTLTVTLATNSAYDIGNPDSATVTIHDPNVPQLNIIGGSQITAGTSTTLTIQANQTVSQDTQVLLSFSGTAQAGIDYDVPDPVVTIPAGQQSVSFSLTTLVNPIIEPQRYIVVSIAQSPAGAYTVQTPGSTVVTLGTPQSAPPFVTISSGINYLHKGTPFQVSVGLTQATDTTLTINLSFSGTAKAGVDYTPPAGLIQIPAGQTVAQVTIPTLVDNLVEADTTLTVSIAPSTSYQIGNPNSVTTTITSNVVPTITISSSTSSLSEGADATFTITANQAPVKDTSINFSVAGTVQAGVDYVPLAGTVILPAGQTQVTVSFQSIEKDIVFEPTDMIVGSWPIRIGQVYVKQGQTISAGSPIMDLTESQNTITLQASPSDFTKLALGQSCTFTIAGSQTEYNGTISELDSNPTIQSGSGSSSSQQIFEGRIAVTNLPKSDRNADGASVSITVVTQEADNVLAVPIAAIKQNGTGVDEVRVIDMSAKQKVKTVPVTTGLTEGSYVQITGGLKLGETVIVSVSQG